MECQEPKAKRLAERVAELRVEWKRLWNERFDDRVRAEGVASGDYSLLYVEKGTVIFATRNFRPLSFSDILEEQGIGDSYRFVSPLPNVGGWGKFIKTSVMQGRRRHGSRRALHCPPEEKKSQQLKKGGRGWLHI